VGDDLHLVYDAMVNGQPPELPSSPWTKVKAVSLVPWPPVSMTHCTLVYVIEANFHKIDASGQLFTSHSVMLERQALGSQNSVQKSSGSQAPITKALAITAASLAVTRNACLRKQHHRGTHDD
jgi:hypothetical protein